MSCLLAALVLQAAAGTLGGTEVTEASGIVASRDDCLWINNDSGDGPFLYAFDQKGQPLGKVELTGAKSVDWEDLAAGPMRGKKGRWLYVGDIGDNRSKRADVRIYAIPEPKPTSGKVEATTFVATYPDGPHNAEALLCDPETGQLTIVTKVLAKRCGVYQFPNPPQPTNILKKVGELPIPDGAIPLVTGGSFRPDGKGVALVTYSHLFELRGKTWWTATPTVRRLPPLQQCEAVGYAPDGKTLWLTSEGKGAPLYRIPATK